MLERGRVCIVCFGISLSPSILNERYYLNPVLEYRSLNKDQKEISYDGTKSLQVDNFSNNLV